MLGTLLSRGAARGLGYAKLVSVGNEADLGVGEIVELLVDDADTRVIALFLETVRDAARLSRAARKKAHAAGKPIVAYKLGRSRARRGARALAHRRARRHRCRARRVLPRLRHRARRHARDAGRDPAAFAGRDRPARPRAGVSVVTTTGGGAASVVDRLGPARHRARLDDTT